MVFVASSCGPSRSTNLEKKARCATVGRAFITGLEQKTSGAPAITNATFPYNSAANTCLCRYEALWGSERAGSEYVIIDVLSNRMMADYDTLVPKEEHLRQYRAAVSAMDNDRPLPALAQ